LRSQGDILPYDIVIKRFNVYAVQINGAFLYIVEVEAQPDKGGFPLTGRADNRQGFSVSANCLFIRGLYDQYTALPPE
jgi:hypothetical protein